MPDDLPVPTKDRSHWKVERFANFEDMRIAHIRDWQAAGESMRLQAAWDLVVEYWVGMKGMHPDELRLQRTVTSVQRL
jgi:hypothetical protein